MMRDKDRLLKKAKKSNSIHHWDQARKARNEVGRLIENLKIDYLKDQQTLHKNDPKEFWKSIAMVFPGKKRSSNQVWLKDKVTNIEVKTEEVPEYMNSFFTEIGPDLAKKHKTAWEYFGSTLDEAMPDLGVDFDEVRELCKEIEILKSSGIDDISPRLCKDAFLVLSEQIVHLFICSLTKVVFPCDWKAAKVVPIFKGGNREEVDNYRPVSLLPLPGKLLEKIAHKRISNYLEANFCF